MLSRAQLLHFAEHGWVVIEDVLSAERCAEYKAAIERLVRVKQPLNPEYVAPGMSVLDHTIMHDNIFLEWYDRTGILNANCQLLGAKLRYNDSHAHITRPHSDRHTRGEALRNPDTFNWHRGLRPKWGTFPHDDDPELIHSSFLVNITYLTAVSPFNGSTAVLDGSHRLEGDYRSLRERCPVVMVPAKAGSILIFTETLIHSAVPVTSETVRYALFNSFTPPWYVPWPNYEIPRNFVNGLASPVLRQIFGTNGYRDNDAQNPEALVELPSRDLAAV